MSKREKCIKITLFLGFLIKKVINHIKYIGVRLKWWIWDDKKVNF